jgi:epoxyqueuosine reductase
VSDRAPDPILQAAQELGFARAGLAAIEPLRHEQVLRGWLDAGMAGEMGYLVETADQRAHPGGLLAGARSAVVVAASYEARGTQAPPPPGEGRLARYACGEDYHVVMRRRLERLAGRIDDLCGRRVEHRAVVDTAPLLERELAMAAGIGFIGKNTMLISPGLGSYTVLGVLLLDLELPAAAPARARCGRCDLCIKACPTGALTAPYTLDARRCISYLTIEHRGAIPQELRPKVAPWVFGCDACQEACPYNARAGRRGLAPDPELAPNDGLISLPLVDLLGLRSGAYRRLVRGRALRRISRHGLIRNAAIAAGGARLTAPLRAGLTEASRSPRPEVRDAALWALATAPPQELRTSEVVTLAEGKEMHDIIKVVVR